MSTTKTSIFVGLLVFLCLSLSSANRVLKDSNNVENEATSNVVSSAKDEVHNIGDAELSSKVVKGSIPELGSNIGPLNGEWCSHGGNCGGYVSPPSYNCGGNSGCQPHYSCSPCPWQGCQACQGPPQGCQACQGPPQGCQGGCQEPPHGCQGCLEPPPCGYEAVNENTSKVQESTHVGEPYPPSISPAAQPGHDNMKSNGEKSNGGLV